ncbi:MAG: zf-TFIIB domain-containing protein [bacterium]|nr:zf-TFIIB domain-containing protein [bacterium]
MRTCPNCGKELKEVKLYTETIDRCEDCDGSFFDKGELEAIIKTVEIFMKIKLDEEDIDTIPRPEKTREMKCPGCEMLMEKKEVAGVYLDVCPRCEGFWLDRGEIFALKIAEDHIKENMNLYIRLGE